MSNASICAPRSTRKVAISAVAAKCSVCCRRRERARRPDPPTPGCAGDRQYSQTCGGMDVHVCAALDEKRHSSGRPIGTPKLPAHQRLLVLTSAPASISASIIARLRCPTAPRIGGAPNARPGSGSLMAVPSTGCSVSVCRTAWCHSIGWPRRAGPVARNGQWRSCDDPTVRLVTTQTTNTDSEDQGVGALCSTASGIRH